MEEKGEGKGFLNLLSFSSFVEWEEVSQIEELLLEVWFSPLIFAITPPRFSRLFICHSDVSNCEDHLFSNDE